ncbi:hypothetical protein PENTCL1PPCAC_18078, partial [Pristionchus entomophagus]
LQMLRCLVFVSLLILASEGRRCYSCTSAADCLSVGTGRIQECDSHTQCYTVSINGRVQLKGCTAECAHVERHSEIHACHTCNGDLCNAASTLQANNQDHHHHRQHRREARRHNDNNNNIGSGVNVGGGAGIGGGAGPSNSNYGSNYGSGIGNGASVGGHGNAGIGSGASIGGNGGIGGGVQPQGSHKRHYKRTIGHGAGFDSSIGGGAASIGEGAYPGNFNSYGPSAGGIGGGAVPEPYPSQRNGNNQWNEQAGYGGIGSGARPYNSASLPSLAALAAPLALFVFRR